LYMNRILILLILILPLIWSPSGAIDLESSRLELGIQSLKNGGADYINSFDRNQQSDEFESDFDDGEGIYEYDYKSTKRAFVYSLLVPGLGQRYAKSHPIKTLAFIGVEVGLWMGYFNRRNKGDIRTDEYIDFADLHWLKGPGDSTYYDWLSNQEDSADIVGGHDLENADYQQYYEMIGKYDLFRAGWDDYWVNPAKYDSVDFYTSPHRERYLVMRDEANSFYDNANKLLIFAMLNHLVSAFDAAMAAKRYNRTKASESWFSVKTEMKKYSATEKIPIIKFTYGF